MRPQLTLPLAGLILASIVLFVAHPFGSPSAGAKTATVTRGDLAATVDLSGTIEASDSRQLSFLASGTVATVDVAVGQKVTSGQQLASLDRSLLDAQLASANAALLSAQAKLALDKGGGMAAQAIDPANQAREALAAVQLAQHDLQAQNQATIAAAQRGLDAAQARVARDQKSAANPAAEVLDEATLAAAQQALDLAKLQAKTSDTQAATAAGTANSALQLSGQAAAINPGSAAAVQLATAQIAADQASLAAAQLALVVADQTDKGAIISAPIAGTVTSVTVRPGDHILGPGMATGISIGAGLQPSQPAIEIQDLDHLRVAATASEIDVVELARGQAATVTTDALGSTRAAATLCQMDPTGQQSQGVTTYGVTVCLGAPDPRLRVGMSATATVVVGQRRDVLLVPNRALRTIGGQESVLVVGVTGPPTPRAVGVGLVGSESTEIVSGLTEGERVVVGDG